MAALSYVVFVLALFALQDAHALTDEQKAQIKAKVVPILTQCGKENGGITLDYLKEFKEQKKRVDDTNSCFFACVYKAIGLLDAQGLFAEAKAVEKGLTYAEPGQVEQVKQAAKTCAEVNQATVTDGEKGCDRAKLVHNCLADQKQHFGFNY